MKTRVQLAGGEFGGQDNVIWKGQMPMLPGMPGVRFTFFDEEKDESETYVFMQVCLEIRKDVADDPEQVIYVRPQDKSKTKMLMG